MTETAINLVAYCRENKRVCPLPQLWNEFWETLPNRKRVGGSWEPSLPLILAAWYDTPSMLKMHRLQEHIEWADHHGGIEKADAFLRGLREEDWHHIGA